MSGTLNFALSAQVNKFLESSHVGEILNSLEMAGALLNVSLENMSDPLDPPGERGRHDRTSGRPARVPESDENDESSDVLRTPSTGAAARPFPSATGASDMLSGLFNDSGVMQPEPSQSWPFARPMVANARNDPARERLMAVTGDLLGDATSGRDGSKSTADSQGFDFLNHTADAKADPTTLEKLGFVFAGGASVNHAATTAKNTTQMAADIRIVANAVVNGRGAETLTNAHA